MDGHRLRPPRADRIPGQHSIGNRSFILVIGTSFPPGRHIVYGLFWIGAGGIIGIDRRADTDALRERLTSGAVGNILFAEDPVRNTPVILGDLSTLFPPPGGIYVFGLTMQLGCIPLKNEYPARLAVGVIIEFDSITRPLKIIVLGSLRIAGRALRALPRHPSRRRGRVRSHPPDPGGGCHHPAGVVMGVFKVTGDGGLRASWGPAVPDGDPRRLPSGLPPRAAVLPLPQADPHHRRRRPAAGRHRAERLGLHGHHLEHDPVRRRVHRGDQERQLEARREDRRRRTHPAALLLRRHDQGQRPREVPRSQPGRCEVQGRAERADPARAPGRGLYLVAAVRCLLERQLRARERR